MWRLALVVSRTKRLTVMTSLALILFLLSTPATGFSSVKDITRNVRNIYQNLESAEIHHSVSPTIKFSFCPPNSTSPTSTTAPSSNHDAFQHVASRHGSEKPIAVYLPGLDGFGISATQQFHDLSQHFDLWRMTISVEDRSSFSQLVTAVTNFIESLPDNRNITLIGESFGGLLAPAVALRVQDSLQGLVLVNPATSFENTQWSALAPFLASLDRVPQIGNLPNLYSLMGGLALAAFVPDRLQFQKITSLLLGMDVSNPLDILDGTRQGLELLRERLPADVVKMRVGQWLPVGSAVVNPRLGSLTVPTLVVAGQDDNMLPSRQEADRLEQIIPSCTKLVVRGSGHFVLDDRVNLTEAILYSEWDPLGLKAQEAAYDPILDWKLPPPEEIQQITEERVKPLRRLASPVFFSTDQEGRRWKGLAKVPSQGPILFVANHQLLGLDLGMIFAELLQERGITARGLGHPVVFQGPSQSTRGVQQAGPFDNDLFRKFGAVMVTPRNYYRLLQTGQNALLFPGGVREVFHGKDEAYQLFWPEKVDFVRTAARFNATIVPISALGAADSLNVLMDAPDVAKLPFVGQRAMALNANVTSARYNVDNENELFQPPVVVPARPARHYFVFGKPMSTTELDHRDMDSCQVFYQEVKDELVRGFDDVLRAREKDPYANPIRRLAYEQLTGKQAPTFPMSELTH